MDDGKLIKRFCAPFKIPHSKIVANDNLCWRHLVTACSLAMTYGGIEGNSDKLLKT